MPRQRREPRLITTVTGELGELLAAVWYQGHIPARAWLSPDEIAAAKGHGLEIFQDNQGVWTVIAVNHPWTEPTEPTEPQETPDGPVEHDLDPRRPRQW